MALAAQVPLMLGVIDYGRREVGIVASLHLTGDEVADMSRIAVAYAGRRGRFPAKQSPITLISKN